VAVLVLLILLVGVFVYLARQEYFFGRTPPREGEAVRAGEAREGAAGLAAREKELIDNGKELRYRYFKREIDERTYRDLLEQNEKELTEVRTKRREFGEES
jgi:hypothetical protein